MHHSSSSSSFSSPISHPEIKPETRIIINFTVDYHQKQQLQDEIEASPSKSSPPIDFVTWTGKKKKKADGNRLPIHNRLYYTKLHMGSPPKQYYFQIDTGSDVLWRSLGVAQPLNV
ncbi:hypothetical protein LXL04_037189 [Taraxacum kok-saghyz]